jgi:uncharacterized protein (DUF2267 family)
MNHDEQYVLRAAWQVMRDMGLSIDQAQDFRTRLEAQLAQWHADDQAQASTPELAA